MSVEVPLVTWTVPRPWCAGALFGRAWSREERGLGRKCEPAAVDKGVRHGQPNNTLEYKIPSIYTASNEESQGAMHMHKLGER